MTAVRGPDGRPVEVAAPAEWVRSLVQAATDLGYGVERIEPGRVELVNQHGRVVVESVLLGGDFLRATLKLDRDPL